jgi:DNA excision repair protein ERCC-2
MLDRNMSTAKSTVLFSATLSPLWYFKSILGGRDADVTLRLPSPFPRENLLVFNEDKIETRFRHRERYIEPTARAIYDWTCSHKGNVMVFFPSYKYLMDVMDVFKEFEGEFEVLCQQREMDEASRDVFLNEFEVYGDTNRIAFCVMGGVFGEGIDLVGEKLTSVIIVGVGLPQVSPELEVMRAYYQERTDSGFAYAYIYPGINKVLQAAGRLIRTETDRGALLLIDSRFATPEYMKLLPAEWHPVPRATQGLSINETSQKFWNDVLNK